MRWRISKSGAALLLTAGCSPIPSVEFVSDPGDASAAVDAGMDATVPSGDARGGNDATEDAGPPTQDPADDGGDNGGADEASIKCGATFVSTCEACAGAPLHCTRGSQNDCVTDCATCAADSFPCFHCAGADGGIRGSCVAVGNAGQVACSTSSLCGCTTPASCPASTGAAQTCGTVGGGKGTRCLTCGSPGTGGEPCENASGSTGTCRVTNGAPPACK